MTPLIHVITGGGGWSETCVLCVFTIVYTLCSVLHHSCRRMCTACVLTFVLIAQLDCMCHYCYTAWSVPWPHTSSLLLVGEVGPQPCVRVCVYMCSASFNLYFSFSAPLLFSSPSSFLLLSCRRCRRRRPRRRRRRPRRRRRRRLRRHRCIIDNVM